VRRTSLPASTTRAPSTDGAAAPNAIGSLVEVIAWLMVVNLGTAGPGRQPATWRPDGRASPTGGDTTTGWLGPAAVWALTEDGAYRNLRDTAPWKYVGYVAGGTLLVAGLMALVEGNVTWRGVMIGLLATLALIAVYDLPFEDLLLPPNGDV